MSGIPDPLIPNYGLGPPSPEQFRVRDGPPGYRQNLDSHGDPIIPKDTQGDPIIKRDKDGHPVVPMDLHGVPLPLWQREEGRIGDLIEARVTPVSPHQIGVEVLSAIHSIDESTGVEYRPEQINPEYAIIRQDYYRYFSVRSHPNHLGDNIEKIKGDWSVFGLPGVAPITVPEQRSDLSERDKQIFQEHVYEKIMDIGGVFARFMSDREPKPKTELEVKGSNENHSDKSLFTTKAWMMRTPTRNLAGLALAVSDGSFYALNSRDNPPDPNNKRKGRVISYRLPELDELAPSHLIDFGIEDPMNQPIISHLRRIFTYHSKNHSRSAKPSESEPGKLYTYKSQFDEGFRYP